MSLLGKVLAVLNVVAAVAFLLVASLDWAKRQAWADAVLQHDLLLSGFPVTKEEKDIEGRPRVFDIRKSLRDQIFSQYGGDAPETQVDEVEKVQRKLQAKIDNQDAKDTKSQRLARILLPLTKGNDERKALLEIIATTVADPNAKDTKSQRLAHLLLPLTRDKDERKGLLEILADPKIDKSDELQQRLDGELQKRFDTTFDAAKSPALSVKMQDGSTSQKSPRDPQEQKRTIATLLCRVADILREDETPQPNQDLVDSKAYERAIRVCGLEACSREMDSWAMQMRETATECLTDIDRDREKFANTSARRLAQLEEWAVRTNQMKEMYDVEKDKVVKLTEIVDKRKADVDKARKDFQTAQELSRKMLKTQSELEQRLLQVRRAMRDAFAENLKLEQEIRALEKGR
jgi:hypothetical protein